MCVTWCVCVTCFSYYRKRIKAEAALVARADAANCCQLQVTVKSKLVDLVTFRWYGTCLFLFGLIRLV